MVDVTRSCRDLASGFCRGDWCRGARALRVRVPGRQHQFGREELHDENGEFGPAARTPALAAEGFDRSLRGASTHLQYDCTSGNLNVTSNIFGAHYTMTTQVIPHNRLWLVAITYADGLNKAVVGYDVSAARHGGFCVAALHPLRQVPPSTEELSLNAFRWN